jgi:hypothetical protein
VLIHFGDVHVGAVGLRNGNPTGTEAWFWRRGLIRAAIPASASPVPPPPSTMRADFESAWRAFLSKRTGADFQAWRERRDWSAKKYRRFDRGDRMPHDWRVRA